MNEKEGRGLTRLNAFRSVTRSINPKAMLPEQVFVGKWDHFFFCESDRIFSPSFAKIAVELIRIGGGSSCCLLNFDLSPVIDFDSAAVIFLEEGILESEYASELQKGGPSSGWIYRMDRYVCVSDEQEWCIYCEKMNDIAVIALRNHGMSKDFTLPLKHLSARPIEAFLEMGSSAPVPFGQLVENWRLGLVQNYSHGSA